MSSIVGIDYSITGPAACSHPIDKPWDIKNCDFVAIGGAKKHIGYHGSIFIDNPITDYAYDVERYSKLADVFMEFCRDAEAEFVMLEGYAMQANGRVFALAEATGILKYKLDAEGFEFDAQTPPVFKKFACDKGNAKKEDMTYQFKVDTGVDLLDLFGMDKLRSPVDNIVDAYWICKWKYNNLININKGEA